MSEDAPRFVLMVNQYAIPPDQSGGTRHYSYAKKMVARGHRVRIIASNFEHFSRHYFRPQKHITQEVVDGVEMVYLPVPAYGGGAFGRVFSMLVFALRVFFYGMKIPKTDCPDVVVGSSPHLFGAFVARCLSKRYRAKFILEIRDLWPQSFIDFGGYSARHPLIVMLGWLERYLYRRADHLVTLLPLAKDYFVQRGANAQTITWIPNGVDFSLLPEPTPAVTRDDRFLVMYVGAHGEANNLDLLLDAALLLKRAGNTHIALHLYGSGPHKARLQQRVQQEGLDNVTFFAPIPKAEIYRVMQQADAFYIGLKQVALLKWGASPNKLVDYLVMGRPVVSVGDIAMNPVKEAEAGVIVPQAHAQDVADAIVALAALPEAQRQEMGARGTAHMRRHFDIDRLSETYLSIM